MASLGETFVTKSYVKGKKMALKKTTRVSPSARGEGSKAKRPASTSAKTVARGRATVKKKSAEGPKRSTANIYTNPRVVEAGVGNLPMTIARGVSALIGRSAAGASRGSKTVTSPRSGKQVSRTKSMQKGMSQLKAANKKSSKAATKSGKLISPSAGPKGFKGSGPVASRQKKVPIKYGKR